MIRFNHFNFNVVDLDRSLTFYRDALGQGSRLPQMGQQGLLIVVHPALTPGQGVKITVVALAAAEWNVDVDTKLVPHGSAPRERSFKKFQCIISHLRAERKGGKKLRPQRTGGGAGVGQISRRPSRARMRVASSAYSRWLPTGMP